MLENYEKKMTATDQWPLPEAGSESRSKLMEKAISHDHRRQQPLRCPRCDSCNTKFCYYNNYSLSQPRHFCKACKRYWTKGGTLRNVPVGGLCRKNKKMKRSVPPSSAGGLVSLASATSPNSASTHRFNIQSSSFPFSRFNSSWVCPDSNGFDHISLKNGLNDMGSLPFSSSSCKDPIFFGSADFTEPSAKMASLLASSLQQQKFLTNNGLKDFSAFPGFRPYDDMQLLTVKDVKIEGENGSDWDPFRMDSPLLWSSSNVGPWFDP